MLHSSSLILAKYKVYSLRKARCYYWEVSIAFQLLMIVVLSVLTVRKHVKY